MAIQAKLFETGDASTGGSATSTQTSAAKRIEGNVVAIGVTYNGSPPAGTTDLTIRTKGLIGPARDILVITNAATDGWFDLAAPVVNNDASTPDFGTGSQPIQRIGIPVHDDVEVVIAQANDNDGASVVLLVEV